MNVYDDDDDVDEKIINNTTPTSSVEGVLGVVVDDLPDVIRCYPHKSFFTSFHQWPKWKRKWVLEFVSTYFSFLSSFSSSSSSSSRPRYVTPYLCHSIPSLFLPSLMERRERKSTNQRQNLPNPSSSRISSSSSFIKIHLLITIIVILVVNDYYYDNIVKFASSQIISSSSSSRSSLLAVNHNHNFSPNNHNHNNDSKSGGNYNYYYHHPPYQKKLRRLSMKPLKNVGNFSDQRIISATNITDLIVNIGKNVLLECDWPKIDDGGGGGPWSSNHGKRSQDTKDDNNGSIYRYVWCRYEQQQQHDNNDWLTINQSHNSNNSIDKIKGKSQVFQNINRTTSSETRSDIIGHIYNGNDDKIIVSNNDDNNNADDDSSHYDYYYYNQSSLFNISNFDGSVARDSFPIIYHHRRLRRQHYRPERKQRQRPPPSRIHNDTKEENKPNNNNNNFYYHNDDDDYDDDDKNNGKRSTILKHKTCFNGDRYLVANENQISTVIYRCDVVKIASRKSHYHHHGNDDNDEEDDHHPDDTNIIDANRHQRFDYANHSNNNNRINDLDDDDDNSFHHHRSYNDDSQHWTASNTKPMVLFRKIFKLYVDQFPNLNEKRAIREFPSHNRRRCRAPRCKPYATVKYAHCSRIELQIRYPSNQYGYNHSIDHWGNIYCNDHIAGYQLWLIGYGIVKKFLPNDQIILDNLTPGKRYCFNGWAYNSCGPGPVFTLEGVCAKNTDDCHSTSDEHCELDVDYSW